MTNKEFMGESMDLKRLALLFKKKLAVILLTTLCGALIGGGIYLSVREIAMAPKWQARSQFYIHFAYDPSGEIMQYYNGYTWNDLIHGDPIMNHIVNHITKAIETDGDTRWPDKIPAGQEASVYSEMVRAAIKGEIISDGRLLTVTTTTDDHELTAMIQGVTEAGLLRYAEEQEEIVSMELIRSTAAQRVVWEDRLLQAVIGGGVLTLLIALFTWWFAYILDDSLYVIADGEKRYPFPLLGLLVKSQGGAENQPYAGELAENVSHLLADEHKLLFLSVESEIFSPETAKISENAIVSPHTPTTPENTIKKEIAPDKTAKCAQALFDDIIKTKVTGKSWETVAFPPMPLGEIGPILRDTDGIILVVPFGNRNGKKIDRAVSFLRNQDGKILGILITEGDRTFWRQYYGSKRNKQK